MPKKNDDYSEFGEPVGTTEQLYEFREFGEPVDPVDAETTTTVLDERSGGILEVPGWLAPSQVGAQIAKTFHPEHEDLTELGRNWMRDQLKKGEAIGRTIQFFGDHLQNEDGYIWNPLMVRKKFGWEKDLENRIGKAISSQGDLLVNFYKEKQKSWKMGGVELTAPNYEIMQGSFQENPSWTKAAALVASGFDSVLTGLTLAAIGGGTPVLPAVYFGVMGASEKYGESKEAEKPQWIQDATAAASFFNNSILGFIPIMKFLEGAKGRAAGSLIGAASEGITEPIQQFIDNAITKLGVDDTQDLMEGVIESLFVGAFTGGVVGGFTSHSTKKVDQAIQKLKLAGFTEQQIKDMHYNTAVHIVDNASKPIFGPEGEKKSLDELIYSRLEAAKLKAETEGKYKGVEIPGSEIDEEGNVDYQKTVEDAGGSFLGVTKGFARKDGTVTPDLVQFRAPSGTTLALKSTEFTPETVKAKIEAAEVKKPTPTEAVKAEPATDEQIAEPLQKVAEEPTSPEVLETGLPPIVTDLQTVTAKINDLRSKNQPVPDSLITRHKTLIANLESLRSSEQAQPNPGIKKIIRQVTGQVELVPKMVTEMSALKASLASASRAAATASRETMQDLNDLKKGIAKTVKLYLPPSKHRGAFLEAVAGAKDGADIVKIMDRLERSVEDYKRKALLSEIRKQLGKIEDSSVIAIDYVQRIRDLLALYTTGNMTPEIRASLEKTQAYLAKQRAAGKDVFLPQTLLYQIQGLHRQSLNELDSNALHNLLDQIVFLRDLGKVKLRAKQALEEARKSQALIEIAAGSKKMDTRLIDEPRVGQELSPQQKRKNTFSKTLNFAQAKSLAITPMDVVFDMLDGGAGYTGANFRIFKATIDRAFSIYQQKKDAVGNRIVKLAKKLGLKQTDLETIGFYAAKVQEGGEEKLESMGYSVQEIASVKLNPDQRELYLEMRRELDALRPEIEEVMRNVYNAELSEVADYFPFITDFDAMSDYEIKERFMTGAPEHGQFKRVNVEKKFTLKRVGGEQKIKLNALEVFLQHLDNAAYLTTVGRHTNFLSEIARSEEYARAVGDKGQMVVVDWLDTIARKGRKQGDKVRALDIIRKNIGMATLGFRLSSVLIQPSSLMDGAGLIGPVVFEGASLIATSKEARKFVLENMPEVRDRIGDDPFYLEFGKNSVIDKAGRTAFWALQSIDRITASSVAMGAYMKFLREQGQDVDFSKPNADAIQYAQLIMRRSQASAFFKDAPQALSRGNLTGNSSLDRLVLQFQTFMLNRWSMLMHDGVGLGFQKGNIAKGVNVLSFLMLAKISELGMRRLSKELMDLITGDDTEEDDITPTIIQSLLEDIPFVGQGVSAFMYGSVPVPALQIADKTFERLGNIIRAKKDSTRTRAAVRASILLAGLGGLPGATQLEQIVGKLTDEEKNTALTPAKILRKQRGD